MADGTIRRRRARGQFGGGDGRAKLACVWTGLHQIYLYLIAAVRAQRHRKLVERITEIAIAIFDAQENAVAGFHFLGRPPLRNAAVGVGFHLFALQLLCERFLLRIDNLAARHRKLAIGRHTNFHIAQGHRAKLRLKFRWIITRYHVIPGQLQHAIPLCYGSEGSIHFAAKQPFARAGGAAQIHQFLISTGMRGHHHWDAVFPATHAQITIVHHNGQRRAGHVQPFASMPQPTDRTEQIELLQITLLEPIYFRQTKQCAIGQLHIRHPFEDVLKLLARRIMLFLPKRQQPREEFRADGHGLVRIILQRFKRLRRLIINLLRHERFANAELGLDGVRRAGVAIGHGGILRARHIVALALVVTFGQQQL